MTKRLSVLMTVVLVALAASGTGASSEGYRPPTLMHRYGAGGSLAVGDWLLEFSGFQWLAVDGTVTGTAFGPGRAELAYCTVGGAAGSALWLVSVPDFDEDGNWNAGPIEGATRLLWRAPEGRTLSGPLWWAPNGSSIALLARAGDTTSLVRVDYLSGATTTLAHDVNVVAAAWEHSGRRIAYVTESQGERRLWLQPTPPGEPRQLGEGGLNLRWSLDGKLYWLDPESAASWVERVWDPVSDEVQTLGPQPARPPDAQWSPDGLLCATLEPIGATEEKQLLIYPSASQTGEAIPLPDAHPQRLLGWSPGSNLVLVLVAGDQLLAVSGQPAGPQLTRTLISEGVGTNIENEIKTGATLVHYPVIDPGAGPPAWSSGGDRLAYVCAGKDAYREALYNVDRWAVPYGRVIVDALTRRYIQPGPFTDDEEVQEVLANMRNIDLALMMYLADNKDVFPPVGDIEDLLPILDKYVRSRSIYMRPGTEDDVVVQYLVPPGMRWADYGDVAVMPLAIVDYAPDFLVIAFGDGHAELLDKNDENLAALEDWWAEFDALRAEDPSAPPPPFPPEE